MARPPVAEQVQVNFRMPADLKERIEEAAKANNRSTTAEIVATLEEKYPALSGPDVESMTMTEWLSYIDKGQNPADVKSRVEEVNLRLRKSASLHIFEVRYTDVSPLGFPEELYIARSRTHPDVQARNEGRQSPLSRLKPDTPTDD